MSAEETSSSPLEADAAPQNEAEAVPVKEKMASEPGAAPDDEELVSAAEAVPADDKHIPEPEAPPADERVASDTGALPADEKLAFEPEAFPADEHISSDPKAPRIPEPEALPADEYLGSAPPADGVLRSAPTPDLSSSASAAPPTAGKTDGRIGKVSDEDLKKMVLIPEYLANNMAAAVSSDRAAYPDGPGLTGNTQAPVCPLLVFINSKSGGRLGPALRTILAELISPLQVYDLASTKPSNVLRYGVGCLDRLGSAGDECAQITRKNLRIMVAGGDGTVGWVLGSIAELCAQSSSGHIPPVGIIPLGTGNDLSRSFGWGAGFPSANRSKVKKWLVKAVTASVSTLDSWQVVVKPSPNLTKVDLIFPHCMQPQHHIPLPTSVSGDKNEKPEADPAFEGIFWNYFSIGMDAEVAYGFHKLRDEKPWLARGRVANQMIYSGYGCTQGWFCTSCSTGPRGRGVKNIVHLSIKKPQSSTDEWEEVNIPSNIRAIVILNLQSYAGGRNPWGRPGAGTLQKEGFVEAKADDGLLEIVGLRDGWHTAFVMISVLTAVRLCQAKAIRLELGGKRRRGFLQMDGEPWQQPLGRPNEPTTVVEIERVSVPSVMLQRVRS